MGKNQVSKLSEEPKREQKSGNVNGQVTLTVKPSSTEVAKRLAKQKSGGVSKKVKSAKGQKKTDHSQVQVIASILARRRPEKCAATSKVSTLKRGKQNSPKTPKPTARKLAGKVVKKTVDISKPSRSRSMKDTASYRKGSVAVGVGRNGEDQRKGSRVYGNSPRNHVARLLRSQISDISTKMQPKRLEAERETNKRRCRKRKRKTVEPHEDETSRIKKRVKYLLNRMKVEQNLIDAYSAEGWKGQSREKIRPERELLRAKAQIIQFQVGIREAVQQLDCLGQKGSIENSVFDSQGRIYHGDIFCAKCKLQDALVDNDIILCDGFCNRAFHQLCLEPPLSTEDIPPGDEGWLCPVCECKLECLDVVNAYLGTSYRVEDHWKTIFAEAVAVANGDGKLIADVEEWPSEDSEDDDYNPDQDVLQIDRKTEEQEGPANSNDSRGRSLNGKASATSSSSDEDSEISFFDEFAGNSQSGLLSPGIFEGRNDAEEPASRDEGSTLLVEGKRQRKEVDYKKLHDEMFGKGALTDGASEDEEWDNASIDEANQDRGWRRRKGPKLLKNSEELPQTDTKGHQQEWEPIKDAQNLVLTKSPNASTNKQSRGRLPANAVEKLRAIFKENPLPSKACKEGLSQQLGLSFRKVNFWFKNVRYAALKKGLVERTKGRAKRSAASNCATGTVPGLCLSRPPSELMNRSKACEEKVSEQNSAFSGLMEILCEAELKVERLKTILLEGRPKVLPCETVMYVAVAELREKVLS